jgi:hypothetical protein
MSSPATIILQIQYPLDYPDEAPRLDLSMPPNAPKHPFFDIHTDRDGLMSALEPTVEENLGMAMVYTLVLAVKDAAERLIAERQQAAEDEREHEIAKVEEEENRKFHGTPVTRESFLAWRTRFKEELEDAEKKRLEDALAEDKKKRVAKDEVRLTGKQLWERGLTGKIEDDEDEDAVDALDRVEKLKIEA